MSLILDKTGARVLCGVTDCGARIGRVHTEQGPRLLVLMPGYRRGADGIFRVNPHAARRMRHGQPPRASGRPVGGVYHPAPSILGAARPCCLPVRVKCYTCGQVNAATNEELRTENRPHQRERLISRVGGIEAVQFGPEEHTDYLEAWLPTFMAKGG